MTKQTNDKMKVTYNFLVEAIFILIPFGDKNQEPSNLDGKLSARVFHEIQYFIFRDANHWKCKHVAERNETHRPAGSHYRYVLLK